MGVADVDDRVVCDESPPAPTACPERVASSTIGDGGDDGGDEGDELGLLEVAIGTGCQRRRGRRRAANLLQQDAQEPFRGASGQ